MRTTALLPLALSFLTVTGAAEAQTLKIGVINSQEIFASAPGAQEAEAAFQKELQGYQDQIQQLENELTTMQQQLQQQELTLSSEAKKSREALIQQKQQEYQQKYQELQDQANQRRQELVQPIMDKINGIIDQVRKEGRYSLILDRAAGSVIAADSTLDLTQEVISRMKGSASPTPTANAGGGAGRPR